jgi:hypothetical protein
MNALHRLIEISSEKLCSKTPDPGSFERLNEELREMAEQLRQMLSTKNGCYAFENALLVLPTERVGDVPGLFEWNDPNGWQRNYATIPERCLFFAQDVFAEQFGIAKCGIIRLNTETGEVSTHSTDIEGWARKILENYDYETGWTAGKEWQNRNGPLPVGWRLLGRKPFALGGEFVADNLVAINASDAMTKLVSLYRQIKDVPDGGQVTIHNWIS